MNLNHRIVFAIALLCAAPLHAEQADRNKPVNIEADRVTVDDVNKVHTFVGHVVLTQGTTVIQGDKVVITQDDAGFQKGVATGNPAHFRTKRDNSDEYVQGEADRIEHDERTEMTRFFNHAVVKSGQDEVRGQYIQYNGLTDNYVVTNGPDGATQPGASSRVHAVIQPKNQEGAGKPAAAAPGKPPLKAAPTISNPKQKDKP